MNKYIDKTINILKWPTGLLFLLILPASVIAFKGLFLGLIKNGASSLPFFIGFAAYYLLWKFILKTPLMGSFFSTLEHELTHGLFALLTFHKVWGLKTSWFSGGKINFSGEGNWIIYLAPYFFPTLSFLFVLIFMIFPLKSALIAGIILGALTSYHITSTFHETHTGQSDIAKTGFLYSFIFLPGANIISYGLILSYVIHGTMGTYIGDLFKYTKTTLNFIF
jgi:hypothetical protein